MTAGSAVIAAIERASQNSDLNAFIALAEDPQVAGQGPLSGFPIAVKDNIDVVGFDCTAGTPALIGWRPAADAPLVARLREAGAVIIGKTNMHELAINITSNNPTFGAVRNPHDRDLIAGGSSGGSAAAVAAGIVPIAIGTDTAGSVRIPAALCGCVGFRPSVGRYPGGGVVPLSHTRDAPGPITTDVATAIRVDAVLAGTEVADFGRPPNPSGLEGRRLGIPRELFWEGLDPALGKVAESALTRLAEAGAILVETRVSNLAELLEPISLPLTLYEATRDLGLYLARSCCPVSLWEVVKAMAGPTERNWLEEELWGRPTSDATYARILTQGRPAVIQAYRRCFHRDRLDALVFPTTRLPARAIGEDEVVEVGGREVPTLPAYLRNTDPGSVAGNPSVFVPIGTTGSGLPVGLCLEGLAGSDASLLTLAAALEALEWS